MYPSSHTRLSGFVTEYREAFSMFDQNGDGSISATELKNVMKQLGQDMSDQELKKIMNSVDADSKHAQ